MVRALPRVSSSERSIPGIISGGSAEGFFVFVREIRGRFFAFSSRFSFWPF